MSNPFQLLVSLCKGRGKRTDKVLKGGRRSQETRGLKDVHLTRTHCVLKEAWRGEFVDFPRQQSGDTMGHGKSIVGFRR